MWGAGGSWGDGMGGVKRRSMRGFRPRVPAFSPKGEGGGTRPPSVRGSPCGMDHGTGRQVEESGGRHRDHRGWPADVHGATSRPKGASCTVSLRSVHTTRRFAAGGGTEMGGDMRTVEIRSDRDNIPGGECGIVRTPSVRGSPCGMDHGTGHRGGSVRCECSVSGSGSRVLRKDRRCPWCRVV